MSVYLKDNGLNSSRSKALADMALQGNPFAALMVNSLKNLVKSPVQLPKNLLAQAGIEIERLSQTGDVIALS